MSRPGWMDDSDLEEEWVEDDNFQEDAESSGADDPPHYARRGSVEVLGEDNADERDSSRSHSRTPPAISGSPLAGTFLIREEVEHAPVTPAKSRGHANPFTKSIFTPLALESMFEPPSPPAPARSKALRPSALSQSHLPPEILVHQDFECSDGGEESEAGPDEIVASDIPNLAAFDGRKPSAAYAFTFRTPIDASSSPLPPPTPIADPRLKLFQTYDTYTKCHLSALIDTIAIDSNGSPTDDGYSRSSKRIRLSPPDSESGSPSSFFGSPYRIVSSRTSTSPRSRPVSRRDYLGESKFLMQKIKDTRSFSMATTASVVKEDIGDSLSILHEREDEHSQAQDSVSRSPPLLSPSRGSGLAYRLQAASLMAQIKSDIDDEKENTDPSHSQISVTTHSSGFSSTSKFKSKSKAGPSPRKLLRRISAADEVDRELEETGMANSLSNKSSYGPNDLNIASMTRSMANASLAVPGTSSETPGQSPDRRSAKRSRSPAVVIGGGGGQPLIQVEPNSPTITLTSIPPPPIPESSNSTSAPGSPSPAPRHQIAQYHLQQAHHRELLSSTRTAGLTAITANVVQIDAQVVDLSRFVSSSTTANNHTSSSWASSTDTGVKHPGPAAVGASGVRTIKPDDVAPNLMTRVGQMIYDPVAMRWTKGRREPDLTEDEAEGETEDDGDNDREDEEQDDLSEDPFRDIESLRDVTGESMRDAERDSGADDADGGSVSTTDDDRDREGFHFATDGNQHPPATRARDYLTGDSDEDGGYDEGEAGNVSRRPPMLDDSETESSQHDHDDEDGIHHPQSVATTSHSDLQRNFESGWDDQSFAAPTHGRSLDFDATPRPTRHHRRQTSLSISVTATPRPILVPSQSTPQPFPYPNPRARPTIPALSNPPRSVLKQTPSGSGSGPIFNNTSVTPYGSGKSHRRSVSFSDGKTYGKIRGLRENENGGSEHDGDVDVLDDQDGDEYGGTIRSVSQAPSARTKRIAGLLDALGEQTTADNWETPSKSTGRGVHDSSMLLPLVGRARTTSHTYSQSLSVIASASHVASTDQYSGDPSNSSIVPVIRRTASITTTTRRGHAPGDQTFLTECSFAVTQDKLVQAITQVQPYEPHWENLPEIDLSGRGVESVARMMEFLPSLVNLNLHRNQLAWLSGVPGNVRNLRVSSNVLTSLTAYSHLRNLEYLDLSDNAIDSLHQLECLPLLRELKVDGNRVINVEGLEKMSGLVKLSLKRNHLAQINLRTCTWPKLESLDVSQNRIQSITGLSTLPSLVLLNIDNNLLANITTSAALPRLRILRLSQNRLTEFNAAPFPNLRTLYIDGNRLVTLHEMKRLSKLENLSLRTQIGGKLILTARDVRDVKRLYLSGNPFDGLPFLSEPCYNLVYLEVAACRISTLPPSLSSMIPNVRVLNMNYNFLSDATPLEGFKRLRKLSLVGSRLRGMRTIMKALRKMKDVEMLDLRMNPCTLGWYLPILVNDANGAPKSSDVMPASNSPPSSISRTESDLGESSALQIYHSEIQPRPPAPPRPQRQETTWQDLDAKFRRDLPDELYMDRLAYRGLVMRACPRIRTLDGVTIGEPERVKAEKLLIKMLKSREAGKGQEVAM